MSEAVAYESLVIGNRSCDEWKLNPVECVSCVYSDKCKAGQKSIEKLDAETTPVLKKPAVQKVQNIRTAEASRARFEQALKSGNPAQWYLDNTGPQ